jgi:hypothetical protein
MKTIKSIFLILSGSLITLLIIEIILRFMPVMNPTDLTAGIGHGEAAKHAPGSRFVQSRDWDFVLARKGQINANGFHGHCKLSTDLQAGIFMVGDSYTEAIMLEPEQSIGAKLQQQFPSSSVCAAGMSGASAAEYLSQLDDLQKSGKAATWVLIVNQPDFLESYEGRDGLARFPNNIQSENKELIGSSYKRPALLQKFFVSALFRYIYYNLNSKGIASRVSCTLGIGPCPPQINSTAQKAMQKTTLEKSAVQRFISGLQRRANPYSARVWIICNDTHKHKGQRPEDAEFWSELTEQFHHAGFSTLRTSSVLTTSHCAKQSCFLFRDVHWSESGHEALAQELGALMRARANKAL